LDGDKFANAEACLKEGADDQAVPGLLRVGLGQDALQLLGGQDLGQPLGPLGPPTYSRHGPSPPMDVAGLRGRQVDFPVQGGDLADEPIQAALRKNGGFRSLRHFVSLTSAT